MKDNGLERYGNDHTNEIMVTTALEFLYRLKVNGRGFLVSEVRVERIMLTDKDIADCFDLPCHVDGIFHDAYRVGEEKVFLSGILRPADRYVETNLKKGMLRRKYRLPLDIVQSVIGGITFSKDGLSAQKIRILATLIDKARNIN